ncbi:MAG: DUF4199 domain-containing protein [Idiomarina sp.]|nr:DUF4199 domain-containing protein [Idiomarina sp.]
MLRRYLLEICWAMIFILAMLAWMLFERMVGLHSVHVGVHPLYTNFFAIIAILIYVLALRHKRDRFYSGQMTWRQGFNCGLVMTLIIAVLTPLTQWIVHTLVSPHFFVNAATHAVETGVMDAAEAGAYFNLTSYIIQAFFGALIMGVVTSAVVAYFVRTLNK